jgi:hypothetical protein
MAGGTKHGSKGDAALGATSLVIALHEAFVLSQAFIHNNLYLAHHVQCCLSFIFSLALCLDEAFNLEGQYLRPVRSVVRELSLPTFGARSPWVYIGLGVSATLTASAVASLTLLLTSVMRASNRHLLALSRIFETTFGICLTCWLPFIRTYLIFWQCTFWGDWTNRVVVGLSCVGMDQAVAIFAAVCFVVFAALYLLASFAHETDPRSFSVSAGPHHGLEWYRRLYVLVYTTLNLTVAYEYPLIVAATGALMHLFLFAYVVLLQPLYDAAMTDVNAGCFGALAFVSVASVAAVLVPKGSEYTDILGLVVLVGTVPAFGSGALLSRRSACHSHTHARTLMTQPRTHTHTLLHVRTYARTYAHTQCVCVSVLLRECRRMCVRLGVRACAPGCARVCVRARARVCIYVCGPTRFQPGGAPLRCAAMCAFCLYA